MGIDGLVGWIRTLVNACISGVRRLLGRSEPPPAI